MTIVAWRVGCMVARNNQPAVAAVPATEKEQLPVCHRSCLWRPKNGCAMMESSGVPVGPETGSCYATDRTRTLHFWDLQVWARYLGTNPAHTTYGVSQNSLAQKLPIS